MEKIITVILIIAFFGWLVMDNCCSDGKSCAGDLAESEETQCSEKVEDNENDSTDVNDSTESKVENNENDSTDVNDSTESDETLTDEDNTEEKLDDGE